MSTRSAVLSTTTIAVAALTVAPAAAAPVADCLADVTVSVPGTDMTITGAPSPYDRLSISPDESAYPVEVEPDTCIPAAPTLTVQRPDGSGVHQVPLTYHEDPDFGAGYFGYHRLDYRTGTGPWRVVRIKAADRSVALTDPVDFTVKRKSTATLAAPPVSAPARPRATGTVKYWTYTGTLAPSPGRRVDIRGSSFLNPDGSWNLGRLYATTTTDRNGNYAVTVPITAPTWIRALVPSTPTLGWLDSVTPAGSDQAYVVRPTVITGTAAPTTATVIRPGTRMSTYGHLTVASYNGRQSAYGGQKVVVQTRPRGGSAYSTVATATTTATGYYYASWNAAVDADVRVAFLSPYLTVDSSYRWIRAVDVR